MSATTYVSFDKLADLGINWSRPVLDQMINYKDFPAPVSRDTWRRVDIERFLKKRERERRQPLYCDGILRYH
jgi:predicted DNA-binding transcriptional regulator AlpA